MLTSRRVKADWLPLLETFLTSPIGLTLRSFLESRHRAGETIYPSTPFLALELTALADTRVIIVGQDPYHGEGQAQGLAFHVPANIKIPPSLKNIHKELLRDLGVTPPTTGELTGWAKQGVLLINTSLTVEKGKPASHSKKGWETFTDQILSTLANDPRPKVFLLWGNHAQTKKRLLEGSSHLVLEANHPSPLSANRPPVPFIGCGHFSQTNTWLQSQGESTIDWSKFV